MSIQRVYKEFSYFQRDFDRSEGVSAGLTEALNFYHWKGTILGPKESPYDGGLFILDIEIPQTYPMDPPCIKFESQIYHPNVGSDGEIYSSVLSGERWSPALRIETVMSMIRLVLKTPNVEDTQVPKEVALHYNTDKEKYKETAREWTKNYAM